MTASGPLLGILGGMGPLASADFLAQLVKLADAARDQDHCRTVTYSNPRIPDRSDGLLNRGPSPLPGMLDGIALLERCGADAIAIPCNTAHYWLPALAASARVPILSIVDAVVDECRQRRITTGRIGILGTSGMIRSGIYQTGLTRLGYDVLVPDDREMDQLVEPAIRFIKAGDLETPISVLATAVNSLENRGVDAVVLGCTELPLALTAPASLRGTPFIDSTRSLARACLTWMAIRDTEAKAQGGGASEQHNRADGPTGRHHVSAAIEGSRLCCAQT
jgi:aspartate racemase